MKQQTLAMEADQGAGFETPPSANARRDAFLDTMNATMPWAQLCAMIEPHYPKRGNRRPSTGLKRTIGFTSYLRSRAGRHDAAHVPAPAEDSQTGRAIVCRGRPGASGQRREAHERHHRGRHN
jgi:hypothetical protein